ncbi:MAG: response regulator [Magnetococcales bacterium]|nr:response regulator [Magnetococcales bacterium]
MTFQDPHATPPPSSTDQIPPEREEAVASLFTHIHTLCTRLSQTPLNEAQQNLVQELERHILGLRDTAHPTITVPPALPAGSLNILLAEDNLLTQKLMVRMLELRGHRVTVVENGEKAVEAVNRENFDLLLMDVRMPVMDGLQAAQAIRQQEQSHRKKHLPILAVTVLTGEEDHHQAKEAGIDGFHSKPVKADILFAEIERILGEREQSTPVQTAPTRNRLDTLKHLYRSVDGDVQLVREVVELFFNQAKEQLPKIRRAIQQQAATELMEVAHSLKGASGAFGPSRIHELAYQLEMAGRTATLDHVHQILEELEMEIQETDIALHHALENEEFHV